MSATNGKTTTTRLLAAALRVDGPVVSNSLGANMSPGIVAALGPADPAATAVLEVDERWVGEVLAETGAGTVLLLNLSRDQLDRTQEVRKLAERWRRALADHPPRRVVANADDPLVDLGRVRRPAGRLGRHRPGVDRRRRRAARPARAASPSSPAPGAAPGARCTDPNPT